MFDETFGEVDYEEDYCYTAHKDLQWGDEMQYKDLDDNGVAVLIEDGEVTDVGYKSMAY